MTNEEYLQILRKCSFYSDAAFNICYYVGIPIIDLDDYLLKDSATEIWIDQFNWDDTDEGFDYWQEIHNCWYDFVKSKGTAYNFISKWYKPTNIINIY